MAGVFDSKYFNEEVFQKYMETAPNTRLNMLINSRAIRQRPELARTLSDDVGGNYISTPLRGLIGGAPQNYDGETNIQASSTTTYLHSRVVVGRAKAWKEKDFAYDITGGEDFVANIGNQISDYWNEQDQNTLVSILKGVFSMRDIPGKKFVKSHTTDLTKLTNTADRVMNAATLNTAIQKASGDAKSKFSMVIMHSAVATNLENLQLLQYVKGVDDNGMQREMTLATLNGRVVMIDDSMPVEEVETAAGTAGVYTVQISTALTAGDSVNIAGVEYAYSATATTATQQATAIQALLEADADITAVYAITRSGDALTFTEKSGSYGDGAPTVDTSGLTTGAVTTATTTEGVSPTYEYTYTTYVLGDGAIEYTNCGVKRAYEVDRDPKTNGGEDLLYSRQRKCWAPYGISFTKAVMETNSPTNTELENGKNWELVSSAGAVKEYIDTKAIPIARIISLG